MPAKSKSQQRLFGMVHAYQKGSLKNPPARIKSVARHINKTDARHFAETSHTDLPEKTSADKLAAINWARVYKAIRNAGRFTTRPLINPATHPRWSMAARIGGVAGIGGLGLAARRAVSREAAGNAAALSQMQQFARPVGKTTGKKGKGSMWPWIAGVGLTALGGLGLMAARRRYDEDEEE